MRSFVLDRLNGATYKTTGTPETNSGTQRKGGHRKGILEPTAGPSKNPSAQKYSVNI